MTCERRDEPDVIEMSPMQLLPPAPGKCRFCAVAHGAADPHNRDSLYYQMRFYQTHGRWPRWSDALAHCEERTTMLWVNELRSLGVWAVEDDAAMKNGTAISESE